MSQLKSQKINALEVLGLQPAQPVQTAPIYMHDAGVAATIMDGTVYKAAIDLWISAIDAGDNTNEFPYYAKLALDSLDQFRVVVSEWSAAKNALQTTEEVTA